MKTKTFVFTKPATAELLTEDPNFPLGTVFDWRNV